MNTTSNFPHGARLDVYEYWRLVLPGESLIANVDELWTRPSAGWCKSSGQSSQRFFDAHITLYRRRVTKEGK